MSNYTPEESRRMLNDIIERREKYASEKVFEYNIEDYNNWSGEFWPDIETGTRCQSCYGTGMDRYEDADCMNCYGEGVVYESI